MKKKSNKVEYYRSVPKKIFTIRVDLDEVKLIEEMSSKMRISQNQVFVQAIRAFYATKFPENK